MVAVRRQRHRAMVAFPPGTAALSLVLLAANLGVSASAGQATASEWPPAIMELMKPHLALYVGGMGAEGTNFHADVYRRMGYAEVVDEVTKLFRSDRKDEAAKVIPDELVDDSAIVGDLAYVQEQIKALTHAPSRRLPHGCLVILLRRLVLAVAAASSGPDPFQSLGIPSTRAQTHRMVHGRPQLRVHKVRHGQLLRRYSSSTDS